jgi:hypothetical protein
MVPGSPLGDQLQNLLDGGLVLSAWPNGALLTSRNVRRILGSEEIPRIDLTATWHVEYCQEGFEADLPRDVQAFHSPRVCTGTHRTLHQRQGNDPGLERWVGKASSSNTSSVSWREATGECVLGPVDPHKCAPSEVEVP